MWSWKGFGERFPEGDSFSTKSSGVRRKMRLSRTNDGTFRSRPPYCALKHLLLSLQLRNDCWIINEGESLLNILFSTRE